MVEGWFSQSGLTPWAVMFAAFLLGVGAGWLIWGGKREEKGAADGEVSAASRQDVAAVDAPTGATDTAPSAGDPCPAEMKLGAIDIEIRTARGLLEENEEEAKEFSQRLDLFDEAIKRANGRLKLILRTIKKVNGNGVR